MKQLVSTNNVRKMQYVRLVTLDSVSYFRKVTAKAGRPAALGTGAHAANIFLAKNLVTALRIGAPGQVGAALHVATQKSILILQETQTIYKHYS